MSSCLLDTNILLRLADASSLQHSTAKRAVTLLRTQNRQVFITSQNLIEFWAVVTRPLDANGFGWDAPCATRRIGEVQKLFPFLPDTPGIFEHWIKLVAKSGIVGKRTHDARLVAVMKAHGVTHLLTFNEDDFKCFSEISLLGPATLAADIQ